MKIVIAIIMFASTLFATMAFNGNLSFKNSDGSTFSGKLKGDPYFHYIKTATGDIVVFNKNSGDYEYANIDNSGSHAKLIPSGAKVGTSGTHQSISQSQLQAISRASRASVRAPLTTATTTGLLAGKIWYRVFKDADTGKHIYKISVNGDASSYKEEQIQPTQGTLKVHSLNVVGNELHIDNNTPYYYYSVTQMPNYLEVKKFAQVNNGYVVNRIVRWYNNLPAAQNYYNSL